MGVLPEVAQQRQLEPADIIPSAGQPNQRGRKGV
jgi:hypothetical protein